MASAQNKYKYTPPSWYKRFVGTAGNEKCIIHVQKSCKGAVVIISTLTNEVMLLDDILFINSKIEAKNLENKSSIRAEINDTRLTGILTLNGTQIKLDAQEDYTNASRLKLYEYSYVEEGNFPTFGDENAKYSYHYSLSIVPESQVDAFEKKLSPESAKYYLMGLKGENIELPPLHYDNINYQRVTYNQDGILTIQSNYYIYEGGAHGMHGQSYTHYDLEKNKTIVLEDILLDGYQRKLPHLLLKKAQQEGVPLLFPDEEKGIEVSKNFLFKANKIIFIYQPYEIAPYAAGVVEIGIPYNEIKTLLKPNSPLKKTTQN